MTSICLQKATIDAYMGEERFNVCDDISRIHIAVNGSEARVKACIPGSSTRRTYVIDVTVRTNGQSILRTSCTCPVGYKCKHINKVLYRIRSSQTNPISGPSRHQINGAAQIQRGACVYLAITSKSEADSGSDYRYSRYIKDNFDQEILGIFFSLATANRCAKSYLENELGQDVDEDDEMDDKEDDKEDDEEDLEEFFWDGSDEGIFDEDDCDAYNKVWVKCHAIEDASTRFHP